MIQRLSIATFLFSVLFVQMVWPDTGWIDLLADGNLEQWTNRGEPVTQGWSIDSEGNLHLQPMKTGGIATKQKFLDFEFVFEWKVAKGANSGVFYRQAKGHAPEYQILDDEFHVRGKMEKNRAAALYDIMERSDDSPLKARGQWNKGRIVAKGKRLEHWLNGVKVVDLEVGSEDWNTRFSKSKFAKKPEKINPQFGLQEGQILLQDHGGEVWYRYMMIRLLSK